MARAIRLSVNPSNSGQYYVLYDDGQIDGVGGVPTITPPYRARLSSDPRVIAFHVRWPLDTPPRGYVGTEYGLVYSFGGAPGTGQSSGAFGATRQARDVVMNPALNGEGYILGWKGGVTGIGGLNDLGASIYTDTIARRLLVTWGAPNRAWVLSGHGGVASINGATAITPETTIGNQDVFRAFAIQSGTANGYSMVGQGTIYRLGTQPVISRYGSWTSDVATDLVVTSYGTPRALMQLDELGGVHFPRSSSPPTMTLTAPTGTVEDNAFPTATWDYDDPDGDPQGWYRIWVYTLAQTTAAGFVPGTPASLLAAAGGETSDVEDLPPHVWNSGRVQSELPRSVSIGAGRENRYPVVGGTATMTPLGPGTYRVYGEVWDSTGQYGGVTGPQTWTQVVDPGADPVGEVIQYGPSAVLRVQVPDNMHTRNQADFESTTDPIGWVSDVNAGTPTRSTSFAANKAASMRITASTSGTMRVRLNNFLDVEPNTTYTVWAEARGSTPRDYRIVWPEYNAAGSLVRTQNSAYVNQADDNGPIPDPTDPQPPSAAVSIDNTTPTSGQRITLNAAPSADPNGLTLTYQWLQDDGPSVGGFTDAGFGNQIAVYSTMPSVLDYTSVTGRVIVTNSAGLNDTAPWSVTVAPNVAPATKPVAFLDVDDATPNPGDLVTMNAGRSYDPAGRGLLTYRFDFSGTPSVTMTNPGGPFGPFTRQMTMPTSSSYPNLYGGTVWVTSADGIESDPSSIIVAVQDPTPSGPITTPTGGVKNLKRAIMFTSNIDAPERYKRLGRVPDWEFKYCRTDTFDNLITDFKSNTSGITATARRIVDFSFTVPKDPGSPRLPAAANGDYDWVYDSIAQAVSTLTATQINNLIINMSHEHTGGWYSWGVRYVDGTGTNALPAGATLNLRMQQFKDVWRRVVGKINSKCAAAGKPRPRYSINYTSNTGTFQQDMVLMTYPGDQYVDLITFDIYSHDAFATESNLLTWLAWFRNFLSGKTRRNDAGTNITGAPKLFGINEYAMHMRTTGDVSHNRSNPLVGDASWWFKDVLDYAESLIPTSGLHHLAMFESSPGPENKLHAAVRHVTTGIAPDYGRAIAVTDVAKVAAGVLGVKSGQSGVGTFPGYAAVGSTSKVNYQCAAPTALTYWMNRVGGPYKAGE